MKKELYGKTRDGKDVFLYTVENKNGMEMSVMNFGAILVNVVVPDKDGNKTDVTLAHDNVEDWYVNGCFLGSVIAPSANRIADAEATIFQSTAPITAAVPIVATAVCATVLIALTPAALNHF